MIPSIVTTIGFNAFGNCTNLTATYFQGNAPSFPIDMVPPFNRCDKVTLHYLPGTVGWGTNYADRPTASWTLPYPVILTTPAAFGIQTNGFGCIISWATNLSIVVEATPSLTSPVWSPQTNTLVNG